MFTNITKLMAARLKKQERYVHDVEKEFSCQNTKIVEHVENVVLQNLINN